MLEVRSRISIAIPTSQSNYGHEPRLRLEPAGSGLFSRDERLVEMISRAFSAREQLHRLDQHQLANLPVTKLRHLQRTARVSYLDPTIIRAILGGTQPSRLSARSVWRMSDLPSTGPVSAKRLGSTPHNHNIGSRSLFWPQRICANCARNHEVGASLFWQLQRYRPAKPRKGGEKFRISHPASRKPKRE